MSHFANIAFVLSIFFCMYDVIVFLESFFVIFPWCVETHGAAVSRFAQTVFLQTWYMSLT